MTTSLYKAVLSFGQALFVFLNTVILGPTAKIIEIFLDYLVNLLAKVENHTKCAFQPLLNIKLVDVRVSILLLYS